MDYQKARYSYAYGCADPRFVTRPLGNDAGHVGGLTFNRKKSLLA